MSELLMYKAIAMGLLNDRPEARIKDWHKLVERAATEDLFLQFEVDTLDAVVKTHETAQPVSFMARQKWG